MVFLSYVIHRVLYDNAVRVLYDNADRVLYDNADRVPYDNADRVPYDNADRVPYDKCRPCSLWQCTSVSCITLDATVNNNWINFGFIIVDYRKMFYFVLNPVCYFDAFIKYLITRGKFENIIYFPRIKYYELNLNSYVFSAFRNGLWNKWTTRYTCW